MDSHRVIALKYAFSTAFYNLEKGQKLLRVLLRAALSRMECSGTLQLCWKVFLWSRCKLWGWEGIAFWDNATAFFFLLWGGRFDLTSCCSAVEADFLWGGIWGILSLCALFYFVCLFVAFLFNVLHKPAPVGAVVSPSPSRTFRRIFTGSDFKGRTWVFLGMSLSGDTLKSYGICVEPGWAWN